MDTASQGRPNQRRRTRKDLLRAATRLMPPGSQAESGGNRRGGDGLARHRVPLLPEASNPSLLEAALDVVVPEADALFEERPTDDAVARVERVDDALHDMILANEAQLRTMLVHSLQRGIGGDDGDALPARQNRRSPLIEAALSPVASSSSRPR